MIPAGWYQEDLADRLAIITVSVARDFCFSLAST
jgi:hypothetical protein